MADTSNPELGMIPGTVNFTPDAGDNDIRRGGNADSAPTCVTPEPEQAKTEDAESWLGYAIAAFVAVAVAYVLAPAIVPALLIAAVVVALVAVAKTTTAVVDYFTGGLGQKDDAPLPRIIRRYQSVLWIVLLVLAVLAWQKFKRKR